MTPTARESFIVRNQERTVKQKGESTEREGPGLTRAAKAAAAMPPPHHALDGASARRWWPRPIILGPGDSLSAG